MRSLLVFVVVFQLSPLIGCNSSWEPRASGASQQANMATGNLLMEFMSTENPIVECRIALYLGASDRSLELRSSNREFIEKMIEEPLRAARPDPAPKLYVAKASVFLKLKDGTEKGLALFHPWGNFKFGEKYMIADFSGLHKALAETLSNANKLID